ncbi:MAG: CIA30 family protein [Amylibacter sp.]|nr:CIA30 family protein [Amylibacter sp.]
MHNKKILKTILTANIALALSSGIAISENFVKSGEWSYLADTVMGGVSEGQAQYKNTSSGTEIRLSGQVSTANNGGFIQIRLPIAKGLTTDKIGIKIKIKGNGERYYIHIRNTSTRLPWHYYQQSFDTENTWQEIKLPFELFKKSSSIMRGKMNIHTIKTIGVVAYGKDHTADISVKSLEFY